MPDLLPWLLLPPALLLGVMLASSAAGFVVQAVERQERFPWTADSLSTVAREAVARSVFVVAAPLAWARPRTRGGGAAQPPILVVPSPAWSRATVSLLVTYLARRGFRVRPMSFPRDDLPLAERAALVEAAIAALRAETGAATIDVVAHSLGGLVAGWCLRYSEEARAGVRRLITLGTPWHGTRMAVFLPGQAALEARPDAHQLDDLLPAPVPTVSIWCPDDPVVIPAQSAVADEVRNVSIARAGHLGLLVSARTFRAVRTALVDPLPEAAS